MAMHPCRRGMSSRSVSSRSLDPRYEIDGDEDPCKRGILRNTCCRRYREKLRSNRQMNIIQGLMIILGVSIVLSIFLLNGIEVAGTAGEMGIKATAALSSASAMDVDHATTALWMGIKSLFATRDQESLAHHQQQLQDQQQTETRSYYCNQHMDMRSIFHQIRKRVLNQEQALSHLERTLDNDDEFHSIALFGPPGVGKSLTAMTLRQYFPWPENSHAYSWTTHVPDEVRKFHMIRHFVDNLSDCGKNLLIIDNLSTCDYGIVPIYNQLILQREGDTNVANNQTVVILYIFNLETDHYWDQFEMLQKLPDDTTIIYFRPFGRHELMDCLKNELEMENRFMEQTTMSRILNEDHREFYSTGCKGLRELAMRHGSPDCDRCTIYDV